MNYVHLDQLEHIYNCAEKSNIRRITVSFDELDNFSTEIKLLESALGEAAEDNDWQRFLRLAKRLRFDLSATLMTQDVLSDLVFRIATSMKKQLISLEYSYPEVIHSAKRVLDNAYLLQEPLRAPMFEAFVEEFSGIAKATNGQCGVVVKQARHFESTARAVHSQTEFTDWQIVNSRELNNVICFERIVIIGASRWFPDFIFTAPRAEFIDLLVYDFQSSKWLPSYSLISPTIGSGRKAFGPLHSLDHTRERPKDNLDDGNLEAEAARRILATSSLNDDEERVTAQIALLDQDYAVFLDASQDATTHVLDLRASTDDDVKKVGISAIEPGFFVLLRTDEGGDYIVPLANELLGQRAKLLRELQLEWKTKLARKVSSEGRSVVVKELIAKGAISANAQNLRNWMSYRGIKTRDPKDFKAIMVYLGMRSKWQTSWAAMKEIANAHRRAGFEMSRMLREKVANSDLTELKRVGVMLFEIADREGGQMTAFRVLKILPEQYEVSPQKVNIPESIDELNL